MVLSAVFGFMWNVFTVDSSHLDVEFTEEDDLQLSFSFLLCISLIDLNQSER